MVNELPDAITNPNRPRDQYDNPIIDDHWYRLYQPRTRPVTVLVRLDPDEDELLCQPRSGGLWQRINQMDPNIRWEMVDEEGFPC